MMFLYSSNIISDKLIWPLTPRMVYFDYMVANIGRLSYKLQ